MKTLPITKFLMAIRVIKKKGYYLNGQPIPNGANPWNPLSYVLVLACAIFTGFIAFLNEFIQTWKSVF